MARALNKPSIKELGLDLLELSPFKVVQTILQPFVFFALYFVFAMNDLWILAVLSTMAMSFTTYGSTSHDLVHKNLNLAPLTNDFFLSLIELISLRSGHAYRLSHLNHHRLFPHKDDIEGKAAGMTFMRCLFEGIVFQPKLYFWALKDAKGAIKSRIAMEGILVVMLIAVGIWSINYTFVFIIYMGLIVAGSWIIPLVTSYFVHDPHAEDELKQTHLFRGKFYSILAFEHLYHLEHHLYPQVPHKNWVKLAQRLNPYFESQGVKPIS